MANSVAIKLGFVVVMCMVVGAPLAQAAVSCGQVAGSMRPCITYLKTGGGVPPLCCNGVRSLTRVAQTPHDRQAACRCLVTTAKSIPGLKPNLISGLPGACGVRLPYPVGPNINCSNVR